MYYMQSKVVSRIKPLLEFFHTNYGSTILVLNIDTHLKYPKYPFDFLSKGSSFQAFHSLHIFTQNPSLRKIIIKIYLNVNKVPMIHYKKDIPRIYSKYVIIL